MWSPYEIKTEPDTLEQCPNLNLNLNYEFGPTNETSHFYNNNNYLNPTYFYYSHPHYMTSNNQYYNYLDYNYPWNSVQREIGYSASLNSSVSQESPNVTSEVCSPKFSNIETEAQFNEVNYEQENDENASLLFNDYDLWKKFSDIGTEMIANKNGRRLFPVIRLKLKGLESKTKYKISVDMIMVNNSRYKFFNSKWHAEDEDEAVANRHSRKMDKIKVSANSIHPDSPLAGFEWMQKIVTFNKLKITNIPGNPSGQLSLTSNHKYLPRLHVFKENGELVKTFLLNEAMFMAVTAYQNEAIIKLKIENNPFAKGKNRKRDNKTQQSESMI